MSRALALLPLAVLLGAPGAPAFAAQSTVIHVQLNDPTSMPAAGGMEIKIDKSTVPSGKITFEVTNTSKKDMHEMIVVAVDKPDEKLPYDELTDRVVEEKVKDLGEASDLPAGKSKRLSLTLKPGHYLLVCNQPRHYHKGMWTNLLVEK